MAATDLGWVGVPLAMFAGAIRVSTPFLFVSLGECLTEKSGRVNLGLEGTLVFGAMAGYAIAYLTGSPWLGVLVAGFAGACFGAIHGAISSLPKVNDVALGIAMMMFGTGAAFFLGKPFIQPEAPHLPSIDFGFWTSIPQLKVALQINPLFFVGLAVAVVMWWAFKNTRAGLIVRMTGDSSATALAMGYSVDRVRFLSTTTGGFLAGVGGSFLSLSYPVRGTRGSPRGRGSWRLRSSFSRAGTLSCACSPRFSSVRPARSGRRYNPSASARAITSSMPHPTS